MSCGAHATTKDSQPLHPISALKSDGWADAIALGTELEVQVREPATCHRLTVQQIRRWCDGVAVSPDEALKKRRLKQLLA